MIDLYSGTPGSGKSLHLAEKVKYHIELHKEPVISNFVMNLKYLKFSRYGSYFYVDNQRLKPEFLIKFSEKYKEKRKVKRLKEDTILLVIDECQLLFNSRDWNAPDRLRWISFFSQHRKLGYHVILVAQYLDMIDKQIRPLIEYEHLHRKVKNIGFFGNILNIAAGGGLHICNKVYLPSDLKVDTYWFKGKESLYCLYDSYTRFDYVPAPDMRSVPGAGTKK